MSTRKEMVMKEMEAKSKRIRLKWYDKYHTMLKGDKEEEEDVGISPIIIQLTDEVTKMRQERYAKEREVMREKAALKEAQRQGTINKIIVDEEILQRGPMLPIDKQIRDQLFQGTSHNGEGRWLYLKHRNHEAPYHRYYDKMTITQDFGWKIEERAWPANKQFGKQKVIEPQFYRRTGVKGETLRNQLPFSGLVTIDSIS